MGIFNRFKKTKHEPEAAQEKATVVIPTAQGSVTIQKRATSDVIVRPLVTEKAAILSSGNTYVFVVRKDANRIQVRSAIKEMYGITPVRVNIQNVPGKWVRFGRSQGKRSDWKKALVTLPAGKTINVHEGV
ncbi:50S ribosomal protein L23 [Candidatus Uhrbacteria bacterium]|nr:50S ribosomal protein L23 [Candidatus Uhrbacteria bacterium]